MAGTKRSTKVCGDLSEVSQVLEAIHHLALQQDGPMDSEVVAVAIRQLAWRGGQMVNSCLARIDSTWVSDAFKDAEAVHG